MNDGNQVNKSQREPSGVYWSANKERSIRACDGVDSCSWKWAHATAEKDSYLLSELNAMISMIPETQGYLLAATVELSLDLASQGKFQFNDGSSSDDRLRGPSAGTLGVPRVGPVKKIVRTKGVFEISQDGHDWENIGMDGYRYFRLYFSEPPNDYGELVSLKLDSKPMNGNDIQNIQVDEAQRRYDQWIKSHN